ncbi:hypothetical protein [Reichenbachiella versicolor]|uniref:hypothetical protein n=1 Tax=Reichenbachiella versicolor TaxID=1821036 RepID=UPI0013A5A305|nr:hypothetical protein [Reichenbachiella versicolor]
MKRLYVLIMMLISTLGVVRAEEVVDPEIKKLILKDAKSRLKIDEVVSLERKIWGVYWLRVKCKTQFGSSTSVDVLYDTDKVWGQTKYNLLKKDIEGSELQTVIARDSLSKYRQLIFIESDFYQPYYSVKMPGGKYFFYSSDLKTLSHGYLDNCKLTNKVVMDMNERLIDPVVIRGWRGAEGMSTFEITADTHNGYTNMGQIQYDESDEWFKTSYYMNDYFKLPLELLMYVNDNGGLEKFEKITQVINRTGTVYWVHINSNAIKLDQDLNKLASQ